MVHSRSMKVDFIKQKFNDLNIGEYSEFIHFGLTSQDINNTAIPLILKDILHEVYFDKIDNIDLPNSPN